MTVIPITIPARFDLVFLISRLSCFPLCRCSVQTYKFYIIIKFKFILVMDKEIPVERQDLNYLERIDFCNQILKSDLKIRSVGWVLINGTLQALVHREGHKPLLSPGESTSSLIQGTVRLLSRQLHDDKLGKTIYSTTVHENVARISMPIGEGSALMLSVDRDANYKEIVFKKIMPILQKYNLLIDQ